MKNFLKNNLYLILFLVLSIPAVIALFHYGFYGASDDLHIAWLFQMDKIIKLGQIPPRFVPDLSFAFGYPLFNFVFPLPFYLGEIFHLIGFSLVDSVKIVFGLSLVASGVGMYLFLKEIISKELALVGAVIYLYTPYRSTDVYIRGAFGEALSFVFLPLILYSVIKIYKNISDSSINWKSISCLSLSFAGLILSHNIVSYMFLPFLILLLLILFFSLNDNKWIYIKRVTLGILGGLLISVYFWLPAISDSGFMKYETVFNVVDHYPTLKQLITPYFGYGASVPGPYDGMSFFIGHSNLIIIGLGILLILLYWKKINTLEKSVTVWAILVLFISTFMMNFRSGLLWDSLPLLPYFQFPWRFLTMVTLTSVILLIPLENIKSKKFIYIISLIFIAVTISINGKFFKPHDFLERTDSYYIDRYIPTPVASQEYLNLQEEYLRLPKDTERRPESDYPLLFSDNEFDYTVLETNGIYSRMEFSTGGDITVSHSKYYFPGWIAKIDGVETKINSGKPFGQISINVPKGQHILEFDFKETSYKMILDIISVTTFLTALYLCVRKQKNK